MRNMRNLISLAIAAVAMMATAVDAYGLAGSWRGELDLGQMKLPLVFNFSETPDGKTSCTLDSPAQGAKGIATEVVLCTTDSISLTCNAIGATYKGRVTPGMITGTFAQRGYNFPLNLTPESPIEERRPQTPKPPFPYETKDTAFTAPDGAVMSATLILPLNASSKKMPAVVMVTGSGPQNRDEEIFEHKPFAVIADFLARNGIASLRYDDRGTGKSTGNFNTATTATFKDDAASGIRLLRNMPCVASVGVLGHSEGGTIAYMLGAENKADFIISLGGMAIPGKETLMRQNARSLESSGLSEADKKSSLELINRLFDTMAAQTQKAESTSIDIDSLATAAGITAPQPIIASLKMSQKTRTPWFDAFLTLNPKDYLGKLRCPVLAINGGKDTQVYADNLTVIKEFVPKAQTMLMPQLNHLMQTAVTGEPSEYGEIRETVSPEVLDAIVQFIKSLPDK